MPRICYVSKRFSPESQRIISNANLIIDEYVAAGYRLTLRQLYYQFVSRDLLSNTVQNYKRLGSVVNDARLAGLIDWDAIEDRTRNLETLAHWESPADIVEACSHQFRVDRWANQSFRVEVWIEKEALAGVFERICQEYDVPYLCCRGYTSQSEMWSAAMRLKTHQASGQKCVILHFGDHDPSGIDMSRDISDRLRVFGARINFKRIALTMEQIEEHRPPPNPAKETDSRFADYQSEFGDESWELDALDPKTLHDLLSDELKELIDEDAWEESERNQTEGRKRLSDVAEELRA